VGASNEPLAPSSDSALVARMVRGDRRAVAELYARHARAIYSLAHAMLKSPQEAEDLIHDVFLEAWHRSEHYSEARGTVRAWLLMRARSRALDRLKSSGQRVVTAEPSSLDDASGALGDQLRLRELLSQMPDLQREVLLLGYFEGLSSVEIAEKLGIPTGTVKSRTRAALGALRASLGGRHE
jgi:RNA polymerase sigma-70 factor (ECF subfamily)